MALRSFCSTYSCKFACNVTTRLHQSICYSALLLYHRILLFHCHETTVHYALLFCIKYRSYQDRVQSLASWFAIFESVAWGLPAIVIATILGSGSDRFGRRFAILPPLVGAVLSSAASFVIVRLDAPVIWFLLRDLVYGCCGSFSTMTAACFGYIVDRTSSERRMVRLTVVQMAMLMAGVVSPVGLGVLIGRIGSANCLLIVLVLAVTNFIYVALFMPSDVQQESIGDKETTTTRSTTDEIMSTDQCDCRRTISEDSNGTVGLSIDG
jgi:MFS family permease